MAHPSAGIRFNDKDALLAFERVWIELIQHIKGASWKLTDKAIDELREKKYAALLTHE